MEQRQQCGESWALCREMACRGHLYVELVDHPLPCPVH